MVDNQLTRVGCRLGKITEMNIPTVNISSDCMLIGTARFFQVSYSLLKLHLTEVSTAFIHVF